MKQKTEKGPAADAAGPFLNAVVFVKAVELLARFSGVELAEDGLLLLRQPVDHVPGWHIVLLHEGEAAYSQLLSKP